MSLAQPFSQERAFFFMDRRLSMSDKPFKTYDEQLQLLISRGMAVENQARALKKLRDIGYYRLSGFWYPCRKFLLDEHGNFLLPPIPK